MPENKFENPIAEPEQVQEKELSPEEAEQLKSEMGAYFEQVKKDIEELKEKMAEEQNEEEKQKMAELLAELEEQSVEWEGDFGPAMDEEEVKIKTKPYEGK